MNDFNKLFKSIKLTNDLLTVNQKQLSKICSVSNELTRATNMMPQIFRVPIPDVKQFVSAMPISQLHMSTQVQAEINALIEPIRQMQKYCTNYEVNFIKDSLAISAITLNLSTSRLKESAEELSTIFSDEFISTCHEVTVCDDYVTVPDALIPDDFVYQEITTDDDSRKPLPGVVDAKKIAFSDAAVIIYNLIMFFFAVITLLQSYQTSLQEQKNHEEIVHLEQRQIDLLEENNRLQREENELIQQKIDIIQENNDYFITLLSQLQDTGAQLDKAADAAPTVAPQEKFAPVIPDSGPQDNDLKTSLADSEHPKSVDVSDDSGLMLKLE